MNHTLEPRALSGPMSARHQGAAIAQVLIQVPDLSTPGRRPGPGRRSLPRRRRRLRRELRVTATALVFALPLAGGLLAFWGGRPESAAAESAGLVVLEPPSCVAISLDLVPQAQDFAGPARHVAPPVVLEEVLPDAAGPEEASHAGG